MTEGIPPSINKIEGALLDRYGNPLEEWEVKLILAERAERAKRAATHEVWKKKNGYARNSHWSVRRRFYAKDIDGLRKTLIVFLGEEEAYRIVLGKGFIGRTAASQALQRAQARRVLIDAPGGRGRPKTPEQRRTAMMVSVEAYMGAGLSMKQALHRANSKWGHNDSERLDKDSNRLGDIYKDTKLPQDGGSDLLRSFFRNIKPEEVDRFIARYRASEKVAE